MAARKKDVYKRQVMVLSTLLRSMVIWTWSTVLTTDSGPSMVMESKSKLVLSSI